MITKEMALATTRQGQTTTILKAIAEIDHKSNSAASEGYDGIYEDLHIRKLGKNERKTIKLYYEILGYDNVRVGKQTINIEWGE